MYRWKNNGGWNKSHGTVEAVSRIDSFELEHDTGWGCLLCGTGKGLPVLIDCYHYVEYGPDDETELLELWHLNGWSQTIELSRKVNGYGGYQLYFRCPLCGRRVRYLYLTGTGFSCRSCSRLNYKSQQETRSGDMYYYRKGMALVEKHLDTWPRVRPDGFSFCDWVPDRPRYMHMDTYRRYLKRFLKHRERYTEHWYSDLLRIVGKWGNPF